MFIALDHTLPRTPSRMGAEDIVVDVTVVVGLTDLRLRQSSWRPPIELDRQRVELCM